KTPAQDVLTSRWCAVMKSAPWKGGRRIGAAWIPTNEGGTKVFGGNMVFREIVQASDGTLGTCFVPEMIPQKEQDVLKPLSLSSEKGIRAVELTAVSGNFRLDGLFSFSPGTAEFGLVLRDGTGTIGGRSVSFDPAAGTAAIDLFDTASKIPLSSAKVPFKLISHGGIVDLEINGNRTLVSPGAPFPGACRIFAFVRDGRSVFEDLRLYSR
ncbi:MAG: hypothetical protein J6A21_04035, partial [Lentisphaeria bacterium]|nr:hypothetical protein [Lentisphaeria bacterium]